MQNRSLKALKELNVFFAWVGAFLSVVGAIVAGINFSRGYVSDTEALIGTVAVGFASLGVLLLLLALLGAYLYLAASGVVEQLRK